MTREKRAQHSRRKIHARRETYLTRGSNRLRMLTECVNLVGTIYAGDTRSFSGSQALFLALMNVYINRLHGVDE